MYGLTYLYRASDFFEVVERFQPESVLFTAYWCQLDKSHLADCYEFAFMGAFGMGCKLLVLGSMRVKLGLDGYPEAFSNRELWGVAEVVKRHALEVWRRIRKDRFFSSNQGRPRDVVIRLGFLCRLDPIDSAFVGMDVFLKDKIPERVPVVCGAVGAAFVGKDTEGSE